MRGGGAGGRAGGGGVDHSLYAYCSKKRSTYCQKAIFIKMRGTVGSLYIVPEQMSSLESFPDEVQQLLHHKIL